MSVCLNCKSDYSFMSSNVKIDDIIFYCKKTNNNVASLIDYNLHGAYEFYEKCLHNNIKPIIGVEVNVVDDNGSFPLCFIALSTRGYKNIIKISSKANQNKKNEIEKKELSLYSQDVALIIKSEDSIITRFIQDNKIFEANEYITSLKSMFANIYLGVYRYSNINETLLNEIKEYATSQNIEHIAFQLVRHHNNKDTIIINLLDCIKENKYANKDFLDNKSIVEATFKDNLELQVFYDKDEIANLDRLTNRINIKIEKEDFSLPLIFDNPDDKLKELAHERLHNLNLDNPKYIERLEYELDVISKMGFSNYYLVVSDYVRFAKENSILVGPARGSGGASLVAYLLNITTLDPLKYDLLFERFLNPERISYPDFDIDFQDIKRDQVIEYVRNKYGKDNVAMIATYATFQIKSAIRDLGRVLKISNEDIDYLISFISKDAKSIKDEYKNNEKFKSVVDIHYNFKMVCEFASKIEGLKKQVGLHAAGIIISKNRIDDHVPCFNVNDNQIATAYDYQTLEKLGLIKMDFLGLKNLTIIDYCFSKIYEKYGIKYTIDNYDFDKPETYQVISNGNNIGIFQLESSGINNVILKLKPNCFNDIVALLALYRPGPLTMIDEYIKRKGSNEYKMIDSIKDVMSSTYGIIIYQEQIMKICQIIANFSLGEADILRRAIAKKDAKKMKSLEDKFIKGAIANGYDKSTAEGIYKLIYKFANYGFNKAHSVGYSIITCIMASLKASYPTIFYEALVNINKEQGKNLNRLIKEAKRYKIQIKGPDVLRPTMYFSSSSDTLYFGLTNIKTIKEQIASIIIDEYEIEPFKYIYDFVIRMAIDDISLMVLYDLNLSGALDGFNIKRKIIGANLESLYNYGLMFKNLNYKPNTYKEYNAITIPLLVFEDNDTDYLKKEYDLLGIYISENPLTNIKRNYVGITNIEDINDIKRPTIVAKVTKIELRKTKSDKEYLYINLEDDTDSLNASLYDGIEKIRQEIKKNDLVYVELFTNNGFYNIDKITKIGN